MASPQQLQIEEQPPLQSSIQRRRRKHQRRQRPSSTPHRHLQASVAAAMGLFSTNNPIIPAVDARADLITQFNTITQNNNPFAPSVTATPTAPEVRQNDPEFKSVLSNCDDLSSITGPMYASDTDGNGFLNKNEYVEFTNTISGGYLTEMGWDDGFTDMPLSLQETYLVLSCLCEFYPEEEWGGKGCCTNSLIDDTGIRTEGTGPGEVPDDVQTEYLTYVCGTMEASLDKVGGEVVEPPTASPIGEGVPTLKPSTGMPSKKPTMRPVMTVRPTREPSAEPSRKPTMMPTNQPTKKPTMPPTLMPTSEPSKKPTLPPSPSPTKRPTLQPMTPGDPTQSPSTSVPTKRPVVTDSPTKAPSKKPVTPTPTTKQPASIVPTVTIAPGTPTTKPTSIVPGTPTTKPTIQPIVPGTPTTKPSSQPGSPTSKPTNAITSSPTAMPSVSPVPTMAPTISAAPTTSSAPTNAPSTSSKPTTSASPTILTYTGTVPANIDFVASANGQVDAAEVMEGTTNQVKVKLEESLLELANIVVEEEFGTEDDTNVAVAESMLRKRRNLVGRRLVVENATEAIVDDVQDVACPGASQTGCLNFNNTIKLYMVDEPNSTIPQKVAIFEQAMLTKIADGWLIENFDLDEALKPPPSTPPPTPSLNPDGSEGTDKGLEPQQLSAGAIVGIILAVVLCFSLTVLFAERSGPRRKPRNNHDDILEDLERQERSFKGEEEIASANVGSDREQEMDSSSMYTADKSYTSSDALLQGQQSSSAIAQSPMSSANMGRLEGIESDNEQDQSVYSHEGGEAEVSGAGSQLAAMAAATTLVASSTPPVTPRESPAPEIDTSSYGMASASDDWASAAAASRAFPTDDFSSDQSMGGTGASGPASPPKSAEYVAAGGGATSPQGETSAAAAAAGGTSAAEEGGGLTAGAAAAIGAAGAGIIAAGAYAATRSSKDDESRSSAGSAGSPGSVPSAMDDLDNAIESGNWGQVGALAAILASQGRGTPPPKASRNARMSMAASASASVSEGSRSSGQSGGSGERLERSRAAEIDKLVESGDWQGVVLAAARFEADQTFDGESYSASASQSSRWTGSATSATTPRSMATTDQSASNISSQRGQEEIRAEVEALVRRVVPEEADNIDEMMTQFKGREEELVETLRRMQERAIASRARLAVQKSAKLEARAKASPRGSSSVASHRSEKSELEQAIEAGNWQALGAAAQKMSNSRTGDLSAEEKTRLRNVLSASPALSRQAGEDYNLDSLIEQGDWQGVIAAAKAASEDSHGAGSVSQEEQEALAQANMWQAIANQSKPEARQGPAGAGDAAAWAIQRSLQALDSSKDSSKGVRTIDDVANEDSDADASQYESSSYDESAGRSREYSRGI